MQNAAEERRQGCCGDKPAAAWRAAAASPCAAPALRAPAALPRRRLNSNPNWPCTRARLPSPTPAEALQDARKDFTTDGYAAQAFATLPGSAPAHGDGADDRQRVGLGQPGPGDILP